MNESLNQAPLISVLFLLVLDRVSDVNPEGSRKLHKKG